MFNLVQPIVQSQVNIGGGGNQQVLNLNSNIAVANGGGIGIPTIPFPSFPSLPAFPGFGGSSAFASAFSGLGTSFASAFANGGFGPAFASAFANGGLGSAFASAFANGGSAFASAFANAAPPVPTFLNAPSAFASAFASAPPAFASAIAGPAPQPIPQPIPLPVPLPIAQPVPIPFPIGAGAGASAIAQAQAQAQGDSSSSLLLFVLLLALLKKRQQTNNTVNNETVSTSAPPPPPPAPTPAPVQKVNLGNVTNGIQQQIAQVRETGSPLVLDLNGDGVQTSDQTTSYDIFGDGQNRTINDVSQGDGLLVLDTNQNGVAGENGRELLGDNTDLNGDGVKDGFRDGFDALRALADQAKAQGLINNDDYLDATELATLERIYGLKIKTGGLQSDAVSLAAAGVTGINLATGQKDLANNFDGRGNNILNQGGALFTRADGSQGSYADIFFAPKDQGFIG